MSSAKIDGMPDGVTLIRYAHAFVAHASYLLADAESATAVVVDPVRDVDPYLEDAFCLGTRIKHVFLTQLREDYAPGYLELGVRAMATVYAGAWARPDGSLMLLKEGDAFEFGRIRIRILETPGHRLEALILLVTDLKKTDPHPYLAFTGQTVMNGDIGRPDPRTEDGYGVADLAAMLYDGLRGKLLGLPDGVRLFPSHTGELEAFGMQTNTMGAQRATNPGFQPMAREDFVRRASLGMAQTPLPAVKSIRLRPGTVDEILRAQREGAQVVDDRDPADYSAASLAGSVNVPSTADFEGWVSWVLDRTRPIVLVSAPGREAATAARLSHVGFAHVGAYLDGGMQALEERPCLLRHHPRLSYAALGSRIVRSRPYLVLDTRGERRPKAGPNVCAYPVALEALRRELASLPRGPEIIVADDTPYRSSAAASVLRAGGFEHVTEVAGGLALWGRDLP